MIDKRFTAILVDDELDAINYLLSLLEEQTEIKVLSHFTNSQKAIEEIINSKPDILFLDVQMPVKTGFDVVKEVRDKSCFPHIIFTTGFEKYAIRAIKHAAFDYLLKPINPFELENTIHKLTSNNGNAGSQNFDTLFSELENTQPLKFNTSTGFIIVPPLEIIYLEASRNYCEIYLTSGRMELVTVNMFQVNNMLPENRFHRISRSHIINLEFLQKVERKRKACYLLADGKSITLPIPPGNLKELEQVFELRD